MQFDTKFAIVVADDLPTWQKLNVVSFLSGGVTGSRQVKTGECYRDASGNAYLPLCVQPIIVLKASREKLSTFVQRANRQQAEMAIFVEDMFASGHDEANRQTVSQYTSEQLPLVGLGMFGDKKQVDKVFKGAKLHD
ncbi:DUF2000 domain-containing protein [Vibrio fluvialis]|uniref:DUF2000 family protein n=1 Tax=Vibrio fluvialis TaxID=676 RepID=UPI001ABE02AB|nr:DUF2000 family protein [Vibrio fluvialis]MBY7767813.1 DUF2000 domain-containing protein [Vibrio fluvialis]MBY8041765.1 DUF2000 domain-containing protein [Vibrio fluvialis]MBY8050393.1 DUF2000 domain-containing protein [Vibrio fluvialis]QTH11037.1 DUF2000 family protein [Vibrio fluvialis]